MKPVVLFAVLNWGLGHASRSIPIINALLTKSVEVVICSDGIALELLKKEYPDLKCENLPSYNISYKFESIVQNILWHFKDILSAVSKEKREIEFLKQKHNAIAIISDNRYGCYFDQGYSIIMSHQLSIQSTPKWKGQFASNILNKFINKFSQCWVPDFEGEQALGGELSQNKNIPNRKYIGCISRFIPIESIKKYDLAMVLSGPEPARTNLEKLLLDQTKDLEISMVLVRGSNLSRPETFESFRGDVFDLCIGAQLNEIICRSSKILCRSGYSSIMDLQKIGKNGILIPTPGQTEQEYLADHLKNSGIIYSCKQKDFSIKHALNQSNNYEGFPLSKKSHHLEDAVDEFLAKINHV